MSYEPDSRLIDWPTSEQRFSQMVAQHRSGFLAGTEQPQPAEACTDIGHDDSIRKMEGDPWVFWGAVAGAILAVLLSIYFPAGFAPVIP